MVWGARFEEALRVAQAAQSAETLSAAVTAGRKAVTEPGGTRYRSPLAGALYDRFLRGGAVADLHEARELERAAFADDPEDAVQVGDYALLLHMLFRQTGDSAALAEAESLARHAVALRPDRPTAHRMLSRVLRAVFDHTGERWALEEAVALSRAAVDLPDDQNDPAHYQYSYALALADWYDAVGDLDALDAAITEARKAVTMSPAGAESTIERQEHLCAMLDERWERTGSARDKAVLVEANTLAARIAPPGHEARDRAEQNLRALNASRPATAMPDQAELLAAEAVRRIARYKQTGEVDPLVEGIALARAAVQSGTPIRERRASHLDTLATALLELASARGGDLTESVALHGQAIDLDPCARHLANASSTLLVVFERNGELAVVNKAIEFARAAVDRLPSAANLGQLAVCLSKRYDATGELAVLEEAVITVRSATRLPDEGDVLHHAGNLASLLSAWYHRTGDPAALRESIEVHREVVGGVPVGHPKRAHHLGNLGAVQHTLFDRHGDKGALDAAVAAHRAALALTPANHLDRASRLTNLSDVLRSRGEIDEAVALARQAVHYDRHFGHTHALGVLGDALRARYAQTGDRAALAEALDVLRTAAGFAASPVDDRLRAAIVWGDLAADAGRAEEAAVAFATAVGLLPRLASRRLGRGDAQFWLRRFTGLGAKAAACALTAGSPAGAVVALEVGRGVLAAQALDSRADLSALHEDAPALAARFEQVSEAIESERDADRMTLAAAFEEVLADIRALPGHEDFLRRPTFAELTEVAAAGPIVLVNTSRHRSDALIVTPSGARAVALPELSEEELRRRVTAFQTGLADRDRRVRDQTVLETLEWLWHSVARPVLDELAPRAGTLPRVWWSPVGPLALLPLHAAGVHGGQWVGDHVISSYTPTIRALRHARRGSSGADPHQLVVSMPVTPGADDLPHAGLEAEVVTRIRPRTVLPGPAATRTAVLEALADTTWAHFACHGHADPANPSQSHLLLADEPLRVPDIARLRLADAEFAFLSACDTARTEPTLSDEAIHLAAAFQTAGFRHVVGTLWAVYDKTAATVAEKVYLQILGEDGPVAGRSAAALHRVQSALRNRLPDEPSRWASYLHAGA